MHQQTTEDYISLLYSFEDELRASPHVRSFQIDRRDIYNRAKILFVLVKFTNPLPDEALIQKYITCARNLCMMAVHVQKFDESMYTFYDGDEKLVADHRVSKLDVTGATCK